MDTVPIKCDCKLCEFRFVVFESLEDKEIGMICSSKKDKYYKKGQTIIQEGMKIDDFFYLKSGLLKTWKLGNDGKEHIISIAKPFDFVSLLSVFSETHYNYSITAIDDSHLCVIDLKSIRDIIHSNGEFGLKIMEKMSQSTNKIVRTNIALNSKQLRGRIAYILLFFANEVYNSDSFDLPLSRKEIAQLIEMTTENVIRIMSEFRKDSIIRINGKNIEIINPQMLKKICELG